MLIRVRAVGINPVETYIRAGTYARKPSLPVILGNDCAGVVEETGSDVTSCKLGDRVFASKTSTGRMQSLPCPRPLVSTLFPMSLVSMMELRCPRPISLRTGPSISVAVQGRGETVLVHGASGGVGVAAVQFARAHGTRVFGTAGTTEGLRVVEKAGASAVFNHRKEGYLEEIRQEAGEGGINVIVENAAHINLGKDLQILARGGRVAIIGSRGPVEINPRDAMSREASISGVMLFNATQKEFSEGLAAIQAGIAAGWLCPIVGKVFSLEDAAKAHVDILSGNGALGKTVLSLDR